MKKTILISTAVLAYFMLLTAYSFSQGTAINNTGAGADNSAMLDVSGTNKGILIPQIALTGDNDATTISSPATSLLIYNTASVSGVTPGYYYNSGTPGSPYWSKLSTGGSMAPGSAPGDMLYWDGSQWLLLPTGTPGSFLKITQSGIPGWIGLPSLTTASITAVTSSGATSGGDITNDGGEPVTSRGIVYSTSPNPTLLDNVVYSGSGTGPFSANLTGLSAGTDYYVRAFATNDVGTAYGNELSFKSAYTIGMNVLGGYVVYVDATGIHGIVAAASDGADSPWGCYGIVVGGTSTALGTGQSSTNAIMAGCATGGIAARTCDNLSSGSYTDWYLPSKDELTKVWDTRWTYGISALNTQQTLYWSSSEVNNNGAWAQSFTSNPNTFESANNKGNSKKVRCVRTF